MFGVSIVVGMAIFDTRGLFLVFMLGSWQERCHNLILALVTPCWGQIPHQNHPMPGQQAADGGWTVTDVGWKAIDGGCSATLRLDGK